MDLARPDGEGRLLYVPRDDAELRRIVLQETRSLLLDLLRKPRNDGRRGWSVQELSRRLACTSQNVHHHLKILEERGLAGVAMEEETNGLARQYWTTDVAHVYTDMAPEAKAALALDKARAHHSPAAAEEAYYDRHFEAMALLGTRVPRAARRDLVAFYRFETHLFERAFQAMTPALREAAARTGTAEAKSALHFAALASFTDAEFDAWVDGLRLLRKAAAAVGPGQAAPAASAASHRPSPGAGTPRQGPPLIQGGGEGR